MGDRYPAMDIKKARQECNTEELEVVICPECQKKVVIHCQICKIQVTGCDCTFKERARAEEPRSPLWTPGMHG